MSSGLPTQAVLPGPARVASGLTMSSQHEGDGLVSDLTHALSLSNANMAPRLPVRLLDADEVARGADGYDCYRNPWLSAA